MALGDLFKSKKDRDRDAARARRKAFRQAENSLDTVKERVDKLKKERDAAWQEARTYLKDGQRGAAQRCLQTCRASEVLIGKLEMKRWVFEQLLSKLELAKTDQDFSQALSAINTVVAIDPEQIADVMDEVQDKLGEQVDSDKIWEKMYGKEMAGVENQMTDTIPSIDDMQKQLEDEVAADIGTDTTKRTTAAPEKETASGEGGSSTKEQISEGRKRLKDLLEGEQ